MAAVHGRSRVTGGAWRPHHTAGFTQVTPGGHTHEWHSRRVQRPREGPLASKGVLQFLWGKNSTVGTPALQAGPIGIGVWGMRCREASCEICEHGSYFRLKDENPPGPLVSTYRENQLLGKMEPLGIPSQTCSPPPLADSHSCYILSEDLDPSRKNGRSHTSFASYWREGRGSPPSTFLRREIETYIVNVTILETRQLGRPRSPANRFRN